MNVPCPHRFLSPREVTEDSLSDRSSSSEQHRELVPSPGRVPGGPPLVLVLSSSLSVLLVREPGEENNKMREGSMRGT